MPQTVFATPFIGRDEELARLFGVLERARDGEARAVLVAGDAGVGKTRVLDEVAARAARSGMTVLTGHCVDLGDVGLPYLPFTEILSVLAADERCTAALAAHPVVDRLLGAGTDAVREDGGPPTRSGGEGDRLRLFEGMAGLLADLAEVAPLLLVLEDLHWADQSSRDLLRFLLSRGLLQRPAGGAAHRLAVLASYRADDLHRRHPLRPLLAELVRLPAVDRLELRPLADAEVTRLVRALEERPLPEATVRRIVERAEGNAFYAEELLAATDPAAGGVPSGLADLLLIRVEQLSETAQQVLRTAAVAGRRVEHDLLRDAVGLPEEELETALREAVGRQLLVSGADDTYAFRHALAREAVYADLLPGERGRLHGAFARLLAGRGRRPETAAERAHHYRESHDPVEALAASLEAADHARRVGAPAEELHHLEAALDLWPAVDPSSRPPGEGSDRVTLMLRASAAAAHAGEAHRAVSLTRAALAGVGRDTDSELAARVRYTLAGTLMGVDSLSAAFGYSSEALAMIPAEPPSPTWVWAAATHVLAARQVGDSETALRVAHQALAVAERLDLADARADLLISLATVEGDGRRSPAARDRLKEARELARRAGNAPVEMRALFNLAIGSYEAGELEESLPWLAEGLDRARRAGLLSSPYPLEMRYLHLLLLYTLGRWDECVRTASVDQAVLPSAGGYTVGPALSVGLARGEPGVVERALALTEGPFDWMATLVAGIVLTDAAALRGDAEAAVARMRSSVEALTDDAGTLPDVTVRLAALALSAVADAAAQARRTGDETAARHWSATADDLLKSARTVALHGQSGLPQGPEGRAWLARAEAERAWAAVGPDATAWAKAVAAFDYGDAYERARCRLRCAEALLAAERREEAAAEAHAARETAVRLGAAPLLERVDALIRRGRLADSAPSAADRSASLTAREQDVLRLLALGRSNRQIGEELFISGKTASVHVSHILAKVGAASRTEAVAIAHREGLLAPEAGGSG
ncbi:AAA family ATPase [Streptomyces sp. NBC_01275]|uniref:ATP-binding protein n=1 Tax=Streptomyces sp. NBC_01275 TaxID=2903807 RepID=UPI0022522572|nr:helix-turn-helix transcriptional regulator [Streptomyces sp. NBC_01275]MCX4767547.1 AAA family ATPase [Streptomyces sp. NBC_01275]